MLNTARLVLFAYAALMIVGGIMGYVVPKMRAAETVAATTTDTAAADAAAAHKGSIISLVAGVVCGALAILGGYLLFKGNVPAGLAVGGVGTILALGGMVPRMMKSLKATGVFPVWPSGTIVIASALTLLVIIAAFATRPK